MDDLRVILEVQRHKILYDTNHPFYKDNMRKEQAWSDVSAALRADPADCKARWRMLRDSFVKHVKKVSSSNGPPGGAQRDWKYSNNMNFIMPFIQNRAPKRRMMGLSYDPESDRAPLSSSLNSSPCPALPAAASPLPLWTAPVEEEQPALTDGDRDEMYHFALSTVPQLLRLGKRQRRRAKMEILQTLDRLEEEEEEQAASRRYLHLPGPETTGTGAQRAPAGVQRPPAGAQMAPAGVQRAPAGSHTAPAGVQRPPAGVQGADTGVSPQPSVRQDSAEVKHEPEGDLRVVSVKTEDSSQRQHRQTERRQDTQAEVLSLEPHFHSETEEHSSDTDNDDDWEPM